MPRVIVILPIFSLSLLASPLFGATQPSKTSVLGFVLPRLNGVVRSHSQFTPCNTRLNQFCLFLFLVDLFCSFLFFCGRCSLARAGLHGKGSQHSVGKEAGARQHHQHIFRLGSSSGPVTHLICARIPTSRFFLFLCLQRCIFRFSIAPSSWRRLH